VAQLRAAVAVRVAAVKVEAVAVVARVAAVVVDVRVLTLLRLSPLHDGPTERFV
jgi:hypothetical protein